MLLKHIYFHAFLIFNNNINIFLTLCQFFSKIITMIDFDCAKKINFKDR